MTDRSTMRLFLAFASLALLAAQQGCSTNAATGRSQFDALSREDEVAIGTEAMPQLIQEYGGAITDPALTQYVRNVGMSMVEHTEGDYRTLPWEFTLLNSDVINAFALPGGKVFLSRGLAEKFENEAQLAGVLGHEIGHVTAEHADQAIARQTGLNVLAGIGSVIAGTDAGLGAAVSVLVSGAGTFALRFDREQENESDKLGMRYMYAAGYNPTGMREVMEVLAEASKGKAPPEWQSTHPAPETRIGIIQKRLDTRYKDKLTDPRLGMYEARYKTEFLDRIKRLPPPPRPQGADASDALDLHDPVQWCWRCARKADMMAMLEGRERTYPPRGL